MKWPWRRVISLGLALTILISLAATPVQAAAKAPSEGFNIITSPLPIKLITQPGRTLVTELRMKNQGNQPEVIKVNLMKFSASGEEGQPNLLDLSSKDTYGSWVHFSPSQFVAQPGVWVSVKMTIKVPPDAALGYYMAVTFSRGSQKGVKSSSSLKGAVATLVLLDVKSPNEKRLLQLVDFSASHKVYEYLPVNFTVKLRNQGNIFIPPVGNIFILKGDKTIGTLNFNSAGGSILPQSNRVFKLSWTDGFPVFKDRIVNGKPVVDKHANPKQDLKWDFSQLGKFRFGRFTAKLLAVYDDGKQDVPLEASLSFWVIPWKIMLLLLVILTLIGYGIFNAGRSAIGKTKKGVGRIKRGKES